MNALGRSRVQAALLAVYPLVHLVANPILLARALFKARRLFWPFRRPGQDFIDFTATRGINSLWYRMQAQLFRAYGRRGSCPFIGLGNFPLTRWFYHALPSLYALGRWGALVPFLSILVWLLSHFIWADTAPLWAIGAVLLLTAIGTHFHAQIFVLQNYHAMGWMFLPAGLYCVLTGDLWAACVLWLAMSFFSTMALLMSGFVVAVYALATADIPLIGGFVPACIKLLLHLRANVEQGDFGTSLRMLLAAIGSGRKIEKYIHVPEPLLGGASLYHASLFVQFGGVYIWLSGQIPWLFLAAVTLFFVNRSVAKFHDVQSTQIMVMSTAIAHLLQQFDPWLLPSFWLLISPVHQLVHITFKGRAILPKLIMPSVAPFDVRPMIDRAVEFFAPMPDGARVLMAFDDPHDRYDGVFDGLRWHFELLRYVTSLRGIHLMPDWFYVFETNYKDAPDLWGRSPREVFDNAQRIGARYAVVYQYTTWKERERLREAGLDLDRLGDFYAAGFERLADFDWADVADLTRGEAAFERPVRMCLLKVPSVFNEVGIIGAAVAEEQALLRRIAEIELQKAELLKMMRAREETQGSSPSNGNDE